MLKLLIFAVAGYLLYRVLVRAFGFRLDVDRNEPGGIIDEMVQDPVCKTYFPLRDARRKVIQGKEYFFCSEECADRFQKEIES